MPTWSKLSSSQLSTAGDLARREQEAGAGGRSGRQEQEEQKHLSFANSTSKCNQCRTASGSERMQALKVESARTLYSLFTVAFSRHRLRFCIGCGRDCSR